jgi:DNA-binding NtrC family response regulator
MEIKKKVLLLSSEENVTAILRKLLRGSSTAEAESGRAPVAILLGCSARISKNDLDAARSAAFRGGGLPVILFTTESSEQLAIAALRAGITDYFRMPASAPEFDRDLELSIPGKSADGPLERIIGSSQTIQELKSYLLRVAGCSSHVLITGETGCGKELAAELVHAHSMRSAKPLVVVNCAAIPDTLLESELFGFDRGAFTGAHAAQDGKLRLADRGTVFLDEIGDLSPYGQAKLLRVIESGEIQRLGGRKAESIDVRVVAATNRDLETDPGFRKDLFFRLNVAHVHLPPLRERKDDILPIAEHFRKHFDQKFGRCTTGFTASASELMVRHAWPGNVRELRNVIEAGFIELAFDASEVELPAQFRKALDKHQGHSPCELEEILLALSETQWNKSKAAERLQWSRMTLYRKIAQYKIHRARAAAV